MHVGATLRLLRTASGVSLRVLADHVGVSVPYLSRVEHGHDPPPTPDRLRAMATFLRVRPETLTDLVDDLRPDALAWLGHTDAGRRLAAEIRRRQLSPAQIARVIDFVQREFPTGGGARFDSITSILAPERVLLGVSVGRLREALEVASLRLVAPSEAGRLVAEMAAREESAPSCVGAGLMVPYAAGHAEAPVGAMLLLETPLALATPDDEPIRVILVIAGLAMGEGRLRMLASAAHLADAELVAELKAARSAAEVLACIETFERVTGG